MIAQRKPKPKKCRECKKLFQPTRAIQPVCDEMECKVSYATKAAERSKAKRATKEKRELREAKEKAKPRSKWMAEAQACFNRYIRLRDADKPCISCGRHHQGQYHAGHYRTVGGNPELRFDELNVHKQCAPCNNHLHGNISNYRIGLIERIGIEKLELLEGPHEAKHYTIENLKQIKAKYTKLAKEIESKSDLS